MQQIIKKALQAITDFIICIISIYMAFYLVLGPHNSWENYHANSFLEYILASVAIMLIVHIVFGMYKTRWEYASIKEMLKAGVTLVTLNLALFTLSRLFSPSMYIPERVFLIFAVVNTLFIMAFRASFRVMNYLKAEYVRAKGGEGGSILIIGAGETGRLLQMEINKNPERGQVVGFLDDDEKKSHTTINGTKIYGKTDEVIEITESLDIDEIIIALSSIESSDIKQVLNLCTQTQCKILIMPRLQDMIDSEISISKLRKVEPEDLLGRAPVDLNIDDISDYIENKIILITGAGGSIGSELCRQIAKYSPKLMILLDIYENNIFDLEHELRRKFADLSMESVIASVRDINRLDIIFNIYRPQIVFHAAAHKHVPLMEFSPGEAVKNNVFGTKNLSYIADKYDVERFVLISTDKAVNPTNVMGATKRIAEYIIGCMNKTSKTRFVAVRFGNVLGSNGSVIPLFKRQIEEGGPVTVTDPNITRYFMTIPEASQLVLQAAGAEQGTIFVLDMGESVKIDDLAKNLIKLSGLVPDKDIKIVYTGLRPGEKMYEELLGSKETLHKTNYKKIFVSDVKEHNEEILYKQLDKMYSLLDGDDRKIVEMINNIVPEFTNKVIVTRFIKNIETRAEEKAI